MLLTIAAPGGIAARGHIKELQSTLTQVFAGSPLLMVRPASAEEQAPNRYLSLFWNTCSARKKVLYETVLLRVAAASAGHPDCLILMQTSSFGG